MATPAPLQYELQLWNRISFADFSFPLYAPLIPASNVSRTADSKMIPIHSIFMDFRFQISRGSHRKKLYLISRYRGPSRLYDSLRPFDLALYERSAVGTANLPCGLASPAYLDTTDITQTHLCLRRERSLFLIAATKSLVARRIASLSRNIGEDRNTRHRKCGINRF